MKYISVAGLRTTGSAGMEAGIDRGWKSHYLRVGICKAHGHAQLFDPTAQSRQRSKSAFEKPAEEDDSHCDFSKYRSCIFYATAPGSERSELLLSNIRESEGHYL